MSVADLIAYLQTLPQDLWVQCLQSNQDGWSYKTEWVDMEKRHINIVGEMYLEIGDKE